MDENWLSWIFKICHRRVGVWKISIGNALKKSSAGIVEFQQNNHLITLIHPKFDCQTLLLISNLQSLFPSTMKRDAYGIFNLVGFYRYKLLVLYWLAIWNNLVPITLSENGGKMSIFCKQSVWGFLIILRMHVKKLVSRQHWTYIIFVRLNLSTTNFHLKNILIHFCPILE